MATLLARILRRFRPREGWLPFLLLLVALFCPPASVLGGGDDRGAIGLILLTALATMVGLRFARSRLSALWTAIVGCIVGAVMGTILAGRLVPPPSLLWTEIGYTARWLADWRQGVIGWPLPFASATGFVWQQLDNLGLRLWWWGQAALGGGQATDTGVLLLVTACLAWVSALFATWQVYRHRAALRGLLPTGAIIAILAFFRGGMAIFYLVVYLLCTLWLLAACHLWTQRARWEQGDTDYPDDLGIELAFALSPWLVVILAMAALFPVLYVNPLREAFWRPLDGPWSRVEQVAERFLGPIEGGAPTGPGAGGTGAGELPRSHLLGAGAELSKQVVLYVNTDDPPPPRPEPGGAEEPQEAYPRRYWRSQTYDIYTELGWANSPLEAHPLPPDQFLVRTLPPGPDLFQQFQRVAPDETLLYAVNAPYRLSESVQAWWRTRGDLALLAGEAGRYTVLSRTPDPTIAELRARSPLTATLPPEVSERYLGLPNTVPSRVLDLARQIVGDAPTRFDRARAIEAYLRTYPYNLDLPEPPGDRDLVDYFLFDLQEGYCDYYASAMVVMARAVGVPARLATGYAQGTYDYDEDRWVVTEKDGHSWVEVYFEGIGWVEFEPTAGLPALERPGGQDLAAITLPPLPRRPARWWQQVPWGLVVVGSFLVGLVAAVVWLWRPRPALAPADLIRDRQARLLRWGARLGQPFRDGQTAHEYSQALGSAVHGRGQTSRLSQIRQASSEAPSQIEHLAEAFTRVQYRSESISDRHGWQVRNLWARLRRHLWWLWLAPFFRRGQS